MFISRQEKYKRNDIIPSLTMTCLQASDAVAVARGEESAEVAAATAAATTGGAAAAAVASEAAEETAAEAAASRTGSTAERGGATEEEEDEDTGQTTKPKEAQVNDNVESEVDDALLIQDPKSESVTQSLPSHQVSSPSAPPPDKSPPSEYALPISVINHYIHCVEG